jgi:pimeloyl-ACP methyl ester carboxylesterase
LQAAVTFPWWYGGYVSNIFRPDYDKAVREIEAEFPGPKQRSPTEFSNHVTERFGGYLLSTFAQYIKDNGNFIAPLVGRRADVVQDDVAGDALVQLMASGSSYTNAIPGMGNDYASLFRATDPFCDWDRIVSPTLIIHDALDPFVPVFHAQQAAKRIRNSTPRLKYRLGGHMLWLGPDAGRMHADRMSFVR